MLASDPHFPLGCVTSLPQPYKLSFFYMQSRSVKMNDRRLNRFHSTASSRSFVSNFRLRYLYTDLYKMDRKRFWRLLVFNKWGLGKARVLGFYSLIPPKNSWNILNVSIVSSSMAKTRKIVGSVGERATSRWIGCVLFINFKTIGMCFIYTGIYFIGIYFKSWYYSYYYYYLLGTL